MPGYPFKLPPLSRRMLMQLRHAHTAAQTTIGIGGLEKKHSKAKPITLRRADYEAAKKEGG